MNPPRTTKHPRLSIVIPAFNERRRLPATLSSIAEYLEVSDVRAEVIVVDDGSTDGTAKAAKSVPGKGMPPKVIGFEGNRGKGAAVREGLLAARGDFVLFMDADNSTHVSEVEKLLAVATKATKRAKEPPIVIGSRYLPGSDIRIKQPWYRVWISRWGNRLIRYAVLPGVVDTQCGFKLLSRAAARDIALAMTREGFSFDIEMLTIARHYGYEMVEVPVNWYDTPGTRLRPLRSAFRTLRDLIAIRTNLVRGRYSPLPSAK
ncbi:MAG: glycosyltransferase family 2 protein [bacterium]|nr:glycosyltransferase family 2 protein [bacterium]MDZ4248199.1 dolichyl-phosphate beta-glucosyltransferase [Patescibacteria group bacterium]